ncbi:hypothetical protein [Oceanirhabdus seepicola]|uniref:TIR domain-containing protein n=1 Tax=Oceanirhabdus seepicola TaxID=2828781 RepID=A0A9J6PDD6_9CLOT|nr:hypothetical protein [Oceanirhabdus seepicola]MCM1992789.1 hypothetical protein [Oceanirhabdus seepicola]
MNINDYRDYLQETSFYHLKNCMLSHENKEYFSCAIWGAVFIESFLNQLSYDLDISNSKSYDLNGSIQRLNQYNKNHSATFPSIPNEIIQRCDNIRSTRNRLVHHTGLPKTTLVEDAKFITAGIEVILNWYKTFSTPKHEKINEQIIEKPDNKVPVFLSTITPHTPEQEYFIQTIIYKLESIGIKIVRANLTVYDKHDPIGKIRELMSQCKGAVILGLEKSHAYFLREKEGTSHETEEVHRKYTSGWLHLEGGLANALGLKVFVLCQHDVCSDGIFDRVWNTYTVADINTPLDEDSQELNLFLDHVKSWTNSELNSLK